ncbi:MAG: polynucleotide adenylyltransferase/metal dependent phosphohydrolase [Solirubrobacterales bacterium]|nr:polynucleotide adenylyltransferase/metal dependent phosphohydrolase [Solirubrobacterales bacterium]
MSAAALEAAREALRHEQAWLVGGAVRDRLMHRPLGDIDLVVDGDVRAAARHLALSAGGPAFPLSDAFGAWRVMGPEREWQVDLCPLREGSIEADLALRDFTVNAIAEPLDGGALLDPHDGAGDLRAHRLRMVDPRAFPDDPLRVLRLARFACELGLTPDAPTVAEARAHAASLDRVAGERVLAELKRVVAAPTALDGLELMDELGVTAAILPELSALGGVRQNRFHHLDVYDHTLAVVQAVLDLERDPAPLVGEEHADAVRAFLAQPLADELTRGEALRFGALLHDIAKPQTQLVAEDGTVLGFPAHDRAGAALGREILTRLRASERTRAHVSALARHHLRLGYLVKHRPLDLRQQYAYLLACEPVTVDVTLLSIADRLATRGDDAAPAIASHLELARQTIGPALAWSAYRAQAPLVRGDVLARELGIRPGPRLGPLLAAVDEARYAGQVADEPSAVAYAAGVLEDAGPADAP